MQQFFCRKLALGYRFNSFKLLLCLSLLSITISSKKCTGNNNPPSTTTEITVSVASTWTASFPSAYTCNSKPSFGNNPTYNAGSCSYYSGTNKRFTEIIVKDLITNTEFSRKCWSNSNGDPAYSLNISVPSNHKYELTFHQWDGCSTVCMYVIGSSGIKGIRLEWSKSIIYNTVVNYITVVPHCFGTYQVCN